MDTVHHSIKKFLFISFAPLLFITTSANSAPYIELGVGRAIWDTCIHKYTHLVGLKDTQGKYAGFTTQVECSEGVLGIAAIGYEYNGFELKVEHISSLQDSTDQGLNTVSVRYRFTFGNEYVD